MKAELTAHVVSSSKCNDSYGEDCYSQIALLVFCFVCWAKEKKHVRGSSVGSSGVAGAGSLCILPRQAEIFVKNLIMLRRDAIFSSKELLESCKIITFPLLVCSHSICGQGYLKGQEAQTSDHFLMLLASTAWFLLLCSNRAEVAEHPVVLVFQPLSRMGRFGDLRGSGVSSLFKMSEIVRLSLWAVSLKQLKPAVEIPHQRNKKRFEQISVANRVLFA